MEALMSITITENARKKLETVMRGSEFKKPALRVTFEGFG
jgi:Fe-S cluster assembly iron-binding protein IscA